MTSRRFLSSLLLLGPVALVCILLGGCAAAGIGLAMLGTWSEWFDDSDDDPTDYRIYVDGYDIGSTPSTNGVLDLKGMTPRTYLVTVARPPEFYRGLHAVADIDDQGKVDLREANIFEGRAIKGKVRDANTSTLLPDVRVIALKNAAALLAGNSGPITIPPAPGSGIEYLMGYSNSAGAYRLGPASYGDWLVLTAAAGCLADAAFVTTRAGSDGNADLRLEPVDNPVKGIAWGTVSGSGGSRLENPLLTAILDEPFLPEMRPEGRDQVQDKSNLSMPTGPWFSFSTLTTIGPGTREYTLELPPSTHDLEAYKFKYKAGIESISVTSGGAAQQNFTLQKR